MPLLRGSWIWLKHLLRFAGHLQHGLAVHPVALVLDLHVDHRLAVCTNSVAASACSPSRLDMTKFHSAIHVLRGRRPREQPARHPTEAMSAGVGSTRRGNVLFAACPLR
jgi:hypothetical protein